VRDELLAGAPALVGMVLAGEQERLLDPRAVDLDERLLGVLLDDREDVREQAALALGQLRGCRRGRVRDRRRLGAVLAGLYAACRWLGSRYVSPSRSRFVYAM
jgi:hypothetical protein